MSGNDVMKGYFDDPGPTAAAFRGRRVPLRRPRRVASRRLHRAPRPGQGRGHLRRGEHLHDRGGAGAREPSRRARGRRHRRAHDHWGERPKAFVVLRPGREASHEELTAHVRGLLAGYKCPDSLRGAGRAAAHLHREGAEVRAPRARMGRGGNAASTESRTGETAGMGAYDERHRRSLDGPRGVLGSRRRPAIDWDGAPTRVLDDAQAAVLPLVRRRRAEHLLQRPRPARRRRPRRPGRADLRQPGHRHGPRPHLPRAARRGRAGSPASLRVARRRARATAW